MKTHGSGKVVTIGSIAIGGGNPVVIQSMTNTKTSDIEAALEQIASLEAAGCEIIRLSVPDGASVEAFKKIRARTNTPLVADVHFQAELAVAAIEAGADKIRINPGNIGGPERLRRVVDAAKGAGIPIRLGINSGSLSKEVRALDESMPEKLVRSAVETVRSVEQLGFSDLVLSVKSSNVMETVDAYRRLARLVDYPLHLGITESGTLETGSIRSAVGLGILLAEDIGDTIRVSLTADPVDEIRVARQILQAAGRRRFGPEIIACPTCARCEIDLIPLAQALERRLATSTKPIKVAVMGCVVNGPGEAADADVALAAGRGKGVIYMRGVPVKTLAEADFLTELIKAVNEWTPET
jgi:(E)-4-hydroxy-3-methylbut-2-enyl-diphosphate synthase